jgi:acetyl esterase/lipase
MSESQALAPGLLAPEFASQPRFTLPANRVALRALNLMIRLQRRRFRWTDGVEVRTHTLRSAQGAPFEVLEIAPPNLPRPGPALVDYHGGGFFLGHAPLHLRYAERYAIECHCRVFFPDYRLSVSHPFPAGFDDCYATLGWVHASAAELGVEPDRVVLVGDSAGGALAAGVAQKSLDRGENPVAAQVLIYPVTDHETKTASALEFTETPLWRTASNRNMWTVYLHGSEYARSGGEAPVPPYAAPLHRDDFAGLPPAWVEIAEFDPLRDEGRQYADALRAAGVPVELREVKGAIHGYDLVEGSPTAEAILGERMAALRGFLGGQV